MNQKLRKHFKLIVLGGMVAALSLPIFANPLLQKVEAYLNAGLTYVLDGKEVMEDVTALTYNDTTYISIRELSEALGKDISYDNGVITVNTPNVPTPKEIEDKVEVPALPESITIESAVIKAINADSKQVTLLPAGKEDVYTNYVILNVDTDKTFIHHEINKRAYRFEDLTVGTKVRVEHSPIMTMSLPPQTPAKEITILVNQE